MTKTVSGYSDEEAARAVVEVVGDTPWEAVAIAKGYPAEVDPKNWTTGEAR